MESATVLMPLAKQYSAFSQNSIFLKDQNMKKYQHYRYIDAGGGGGGGGSFTNYTQWFWKKYCFSTLSSGSHFVQWSGTSSKF